MHKKQFPRVTGNGNPRTLHVNTPHKPFLSCYWWMCGYIAEQPRMCCPHQISTNMKKKKKKKVSEKKVFVIKMYTFLMNKYIATYKTGNNLFCSLLFEFLICRYSVKNTAPTIALMKCLLWWIFYPISFSVLSSQG